MSDEESFVILGTSPLSSLVSDGPSSLQFDSPGMSISVLERNELQESSASDSTVQSRPEAADAAVAIKDSENASEGATNSANGVKSLENSAIHTGNSNGGQQCLSLGSAGSGGVPSANNSLAVSFIQGEVGADVLKTSVYSQFPSLCSMEACAEDVAKMEKLMTEYVELKKTIGALNSAMKQFYDKTAQWREESKRVEVEYNKNIAACHQQIAELRNENILLRQEIQLKMEQIEINEKIRQGEQEELTRALSEKTAVIDNMRAMIENLEQQQLKSFEYIPKNVNDTKEKPDYIDRIEHESIVKNLKRQMSEYLAENLEIKDMQTQYINEITCLKVNLTAAEEVIREARADIETLKSNDVKSSKEFSEFKEDRDKMREEITLLRQQLEVYSRDFKTEQTERQNLTGEKERLLQDLRALQRRNQELLEEAQRRVEEMEKRGSSGSGSSSVNGGRISDAAQASPQHSGASYTAKMSRDNFNANLKQRPIRALPQQPKQPQQVRCPVCNLAFDTINDVQRHVNICLDRS